jgi:hypothetical protein
MVPFLFGAIGAPGVKESVKVVSLTPIVGEFDVSAVAVSSILATLKFNFEPSIVELSYVQAASEYQTKFEATRIREKGFLKLEI